jgi:DNA repair protein RadC
MESKTRKTIKDLPREVFEPAIKNLTAQVILVHNHPSGDPAPSEDDLEINRRLVEAGRQVRF